MVELSNLASWMPTKKYLQARVRQLEEELERAKESIRESSVEELARRRVRPRSETSRRWLENE